jgi:hypothetical protein
VTRDKDGRFVTGAKRPSSSGRRRGTPNKVTREVKEFLAEVLTKPDVQAVIEARILAGDTVAFFKAVEMVHGKPRQTLDVNQQDFRMIQWPDNEEVAEE